MSYYIDVGITQWYTSLFTPCVDAGIISQQDLAGYRNGPIYIRGSMHVPPACEQLMDCVDGLKTLISEEPNVAVQAVLGHLFLSFIHPFPDGNDRTAHLLMNFLWLLGGYPWTVIDHRTRTQYLAALESASVAKDIRPFAEFIRQAMIETSRSIAD